MATQEINYAEGSDTGEREAAAIAPISPGEKVKSAVVDRPLENLRNRSEVVRDEVTDQKYLQDTDMMWLVADGADITGLNPGVDLPMILWDAVTGKFQIGPAPGTSMVFQPIKTPRQDTIESSLASTPSQYVFPALPFPDGTLDFQSNLRNYQGMNRRIVTWEAVPAASIFPNNAYAELRGVPAHNLHIKVKDDGSTTLGDVDVALNPLLPVLGAAGFLYTVAGTNAALIPVAPLPTDYEFAKVHEREMHRVPDSQFAMFFDPMGMNKSLADGDTLAIYYEWMTEPPTNPPPATDGRRQSCNSNSNITLTAGSLFITSEEPEKIPIGIPICKRIGNDLIFLDGTVCYGNPLVSPTPIYAGEHGYTVNRIFTLPTTIPISMTSKWYAQPAAPTWATIMQALDGVVADLAGTQDSALVPVAFGLGATLIGMCTTAAPTYSLGSYNVPALGASIRDVLTNIITLLNEKGSLRRNEDLDAATGWRVINRLRFGENSTEVRDLHTTDTWRLIYRNQGKTAADPIDYHTVSVYEGKIPVGMTFITARILLVGLQIPAPGALVFQTPLAPVVGPGAVAAFVFASGSVSTMMKAAANVMVNLDPAVINDWDAYDASSGMNRMIAAHTRFSRWTKFQASVQYTYDDLEVGIGTTARDAYETEVVNTNGRAGRIRHRYTAGAEVYLENRVLEGMYPVPHSGGATYNKCGISAGAAIVGGREIIFNQSVDVDDVASQCSSGTLAYINSADPVTLWRFRCFWLYVWLRRDGTIWFDHLGPAMAQDAGMQMWNAQRAWGPRNLSGLIVPGMWGREDYCLIGLSWVVCGDPTGAFPLLSFMVPMGDNLWRFQPQVYPPIMPGFVQHRHEFNFPVSGSAVVDLTLNNGVGSGFRSPGVPVGVTQRGLISVKVPFATLGGAPLGFAAYGIAARVGPVWLYSNTCPQLYEFVSNPMMVAGASSIGYSTWKTIPVEVDCAEGVTPDPLIPYPRTGKIIHSIISNPDGEIYVDPGNPGTIDLLGFFWDRHTVSQEVAAFS